VVSLDRQHVYSATLRPALGGLFTGSKVSECEVHKCPWSARVWPLESGSCVSHHCRLSLRGIFLGHIDGITLRSFSAGMTPCGLVKRYHRLGEIYGRSTTSGCGGGSRFLRNVDTFFFY